MSVERVTRVMVLMSVVRLKAIGWVSSVFMVEIWDGGVCVEYCMVGTRCVLGTEMFDHFHIYKTDTFHI